MNTEAHTFEWIEAQALSLPIAQQGALIERLLRNLPASSDDAFWVEEALKREAAFDRAGKLPRDGEAFLKTLAKRAA